MSNLNRSNQNERTTNNEDGSMFWIEGDVLIHYKHVMDCLYEFLYLMSFLFPQSFHTKMMKSQTLESVFIMLIHIKQTKKIAKKHNKM